MKRISIAIDGPAAAGKSTIAKMVARNLNYTYIDTGAMEDVSSAIRANEVSMGASIVSQYAKVRSFLVAQQREMAKGGGVILDGRDIGTVVLPDAELKIYQVASVETRAKRRYKENIEKGIECDYEEMKAEIEARDKQDMNREVSPLKKADDAIELDTSNMSLEEVVAHVMDLVEKKLEE